LKEVVKVERSLEEILTQSWKNSEWSDVVRATDAAVYVAQGKGTYNEE
jgi:hypothetical protein